jgi:signal transduction histidine kinase
MSDRPEEVLSRFCASLDQLILLRTVGPEDSFQIIGVAPPWLGRFIPEHGNTLSERLLSDTFPFVENYLFDAKLAWQRGQGERTDPAIWSEVDRLGVELLLQVSAHQLGNHRILLIEGSQERLQEKASLLQQARIGELAHDRLQQDVQKRDILFHCIVHDFATPLSAVAGALQLLAMESLEPAAQELVQSGLRAVVHQESLIRDVLDVFRFDMGEGSADELSTQAPDLRACVINTVRLLQPKASWRRIALRLEQQGDGPLRVLGERSRLERVLANLIDNALRYAPAGSTVVVGMQQTDQDVCVTVDDEGPGVAPELAGSLFEKFARDRRNGGKAGLGLYFCRMTVERWKGTIGYLARAETGARFWFRLPRVTG